MKRIRVITLITLLTMTLVGCSKGSVENTEPSKSSLISCVESDSVINVTENAVDFEPNEIIPVTKDGKVYGFVNINWVDKVNIEDTSNNKAVVNGIKYSYSVNMNIDFTKSLSTENLVVSPQISIENEDGETIGIPARVGWNGYTPVAQLYDKSPSMNVELGVQPIKNLDDSSRLVIVLKDSENTVYDKIYLSNKYLSTAKEVSSVTPVGVERVINTINGASFGITLLGAELDDYTNHLDDFVDTESVYNIYYRVRYISAPTNNAEDLLFDSVNNNALHTKFISAVNISGSPNWLYKGYDKNYHLLFSDFTNSLLYTTYEFEDLNVGESIDCCVCKKIDTVGSNEYLRVAFEFPEEVDARSLEQMKDFNGKYVVFQAPLTKRALNFRPADYVD